MRITLLGSGGSGGVPLAGAQPGGNWGACDPTNPRNRRRRVSILVEAEGRSVLVDTSPDLRLQILDNRVTRIDAVCFTHAHADHCHGLDELRGMRYALGHPIDAYMDRATHGALTRRFEYAFASSADPKSIYPPLMNDHLVEGPFRIGGIDVVPFEQQHGPETSLGFRFGSVAYSTDVTGFSAEAFEILQGLVLWILDCLRDDPHPTHSHVAQSLEWIAKVKPKRALLTHLNHQIDYADLAARCPPGVEPAYDGLVVEI